VVQRTGGSASWRNNNPGNLKFEFAGSADKTVQSHRSRERALEAAQRSYVGVVALDQWGNAIFETYEAGRAAKLQLLERKYSNNTVEQMLESYSRADYSGQTHHRQQAEHIHRQAARQGLDLHGKTIGALTMQELEALADGIRGFEGWKVGDHRIVSAEGTKRYGPAQPADGPRRDDDEIAVVAKGSSGPQVVGLQQSLQRLGYTGRDGQPLKVDGDFGANTEFAVRAFQRAHHLQVDGRAGHRQTLPAIDAASKQLLTDPSHPRHALYAQALGKVHAEETRRHVAHGPHSERLAGAIAVAAIHANLTRIDRVELNTAGTLARAVQVGQARDEAALNRTTAAIDTHAALRQSLQASSQQAREVLPLVQAQAMTLPATRRVAP
jgi:peptidoglycan hydrolase-like protein with peptidoglycan-binding domain